MPKFNQVPPNYMPEERYGTQSELTKYLDDTLIIYLALIRSQADEMREKLIEGAEGLQWLCYELYQKILKKDSVAPTDVEEVITGLSSLTETEIPHSVKQVIADIKAIYSAHCENLNIVNASIATHHAVEASAASAQYSNLLDGLTFSDAPIIPSAPPFQALAPNSLYSDILPQEAAASSYGKLQIEARDGVAHSAARPVTGREMLQKIEAVSRDVGEKVQLEPYNVKLFDIWAVCDALELKVKAAWDITETMIDEEVAKHSNLQKLDGDARTYIEKLKKACRPPEVISPKMSMFGASAVARESTQALERTEVNNLIQALLEYIGKRAEIKDGSGKTKEFLHLTMFGSLNAITQNSFTQEKQAVEALIAVLRGDRSVVDELQKCLPTLKSGGLAAMLTPLIQEPMLLREVSGKGQEIVCIETVHKRKVTIDSFVKDWLVSNQHQFAAK